MKVTIDAEIDIDDFINNVPVQYIADAINDNFSPEQIQELLEDLSHTENSEIEVIETPSMLEKQKFEIVKSIFEKYDLWQLQRIQQDIESKSW